MIRRWLFSIILAGLVLVATAPASATARYQPERGQTVRRRSSRGTRPRWITHEGEQHSGVPSTLLLVDEADALRDEREGVRRRAPPDGVPSHDHSLPGHVTTSC